MRSTEWRRWRDGAHACRAAPAARSVSAALQWLRATARSFAPSTRTPPAELPDAPPAQRPPCSPQAEAYRKSLLMRANIVLCGLPIQTDGANFTANVAEEVDSDDEDNDQIVEPLRTSDAQAAVPRTLRRRSQGMTAEERAMIDVDLWQPDTVHAAYVRRDIQDNDAVQPWRTLLSDKALHGRNGAPLTPEDVACVAPAAAVCPHLPAALSAGEIHVTVRVQAGQDVWRARAQRG